MGLLLSANCGSDTPSGNGSPQGSLAISQRVLQGKVGGQAWTFAAGETNSFLSTDSVYFADLYPTTFATCETFSAPTDVNELILDLPRSTGSYDLSFARSATFYVASTNYNYAATRGRIQIDEVTATTIVGGANFTYNADNSVDGQFRVSICP